MMRPSKQYEFIGILIIMLGNSYGDFQKLLDQRVTKNAVYFRGYTSTSTHGFAYLFPLIIGYTSGYTSHWKIAKTTNS